MSGEWKKCSTCKKPIGFDTKYYVCSVSTCNGQRTGYSFCSIPCWDAHVPGARHRDSAAIEQRSPVASASASTIGAASGTSASREPVRRIISSTPNSGASTAGTGFSGGSPARNQVPRDILIVASKLKDYIRARSEMNTSAGVMEILSDIVRSHCEDAMDNARADGRKTVMDRDFKAGRRS